MSLQKRVVLFDSVHGSGLTLQGPLREQGFQVYVSSSAEELLNVIGHGQPDCVLLLESARMRPQLQLVRHCVEAGRSLVVVVRPNSEVSDTVALLERGADYVVTLDDPGVVSAQIRAGLRRLGRDRIAPGVIDLGYLRIDLRGRVATVNGQEVPLTRTEFEVLRVLAERPGTVLPSGDIMQHVAGIRLSESEAQDLLKVHVHRLRHKLEAYSHTSRFIRTVRGQGYMYETAGAASDRSHTDSASG